MVDVHNILKKYSSDFEKRQLRIFQLKKNGNNRYIDNSRESLYLILVRLYLNYGHAILQFLIN